MLRSTNLTDESHIEFARRFGELDDIKPYIAAGRKNRLKYDELFDVSNVEMDGSLVDPESPRGQANKVLLAFLVKLPIFLTFTFARVMTCSMWTRASIRAGLDTRCYSPMSCLLAAWEDTQLLQTQEQHLTISGII